MDEDNSSLFFCESFFESLRPGMLVFRTTAAAITGPAKQPLPTSSTPAIKVKALKLHLCTQFPLSQLIRFLDFLK